MRRFIVPPAIVIGLMAVSILVYDHGVSLVYGLSGTARLLVDLGAAGMFMTVWMGAFISHPSPSLQAPASRSAWRLGSYRDARG